MSNVRRSRLWMFGVVVGLAACDAGRGIYDDAAVLEGNGKLVEAATQYDAVCVRAPNSAMCPPSRERAGAVRLKLASTSIADFKFVAAEPLLKAVVESAAPVTQAKGKEQLSSKEYVAGMQWEKALANADKKGALKDMETAAASGTPVAAKANEWLGKERPALLLAEATAACTPAPTAPCPVPCNRLITLHAGTPEAAKATEYMTAYKAAEEIRLYPLLVQGEKLIEECQGLWKADRRLQDCHLRALAADPDNPLGALASCGGNYAGEDAKKRRAKLDETWKKLSGDVRDPERVAALDSRLKKACDDGEYEKQTPTAGKRVAGSASAPSANVAGLRAVKSQCPAAYHQVPTAGGCMCDRDDPDEIDRPRLYAEPPLAGGCVPVGSGASPCNWRCP